MLIPGPFTLHASYGKQNYYPEKVHFPSGPRFFRGVYDIKKAENPYILKKLHSKNLHINPLDEIKQRYAHSIDSSRSLDHNAISDCSFTGTTQRLLSNSVRRLHAVPFGLFRKCQLPIKSEITNPLDLNLVKPSNKSYVEYKQKQDTIVVHEPERVFSWNWTSLNKVGIPVGKPFASETNVSMDLNAYMQIQQGKPQAEIKVLTLKQFIKDLKYLTSKTMKFYN